MDLDDDELIYTRIKNGVANSKEIFDYINKLQKINEKYKIFILKLRNIKPYCAFVYDNDYKKAFPAQNTTKGQIIDFAYKMNEALKISYIFKDDKQFIKELLEE